MPARVEDQYSVVVPTLVDSTITDGVRWSVFFVSALTEIPDVFYDSYPDSGYSVDNLAPSPPGNLRWDDAALLAWDECEEEDSNYFTVYGSGSDVFDPETAELIGYTVETNLDVNGTDFDYYHTTASDFAGNEGDASTIESEVQGIEDAERLPEVFALHACRPNPFNPSTTIRYDLPKTASTRLCIYDLTGRMIRTLVDAEYHQPGRHWVEWDGRDNAGQEVGSGTYFYRLEAGPFSQTRRMTLLN